MFILITMAAKYNPPICIYCFNVTRNTSFICKSGYMIGEKLYKFCSTVICRECEITCGQLHNKYENWVCSYGCLLKFKFHNKDAYTLSDTSIPIIHHLEAEKEIFDRHLYTKLVDEMYFLKELAQVVIEFLN